MFVLYIFRDEDIDNTIVRPSASTPAPVKRPRPTTPDIKTQKGKLTTKKLTVKESQMAILNQICEENRMRREERDGKRAKLTVTKEVTKTKEPEDIFF